MQAADVDGNGVIDYAEFLASTMQLSALQTEENLKKALIPDGFYRLHEMTNTITHCTWLLNLGTVVGRLLSTLTPMARVTLLSMNYEKD